MPEWDAVFLDRDGTLNVSPSPGAYVLRPDDLHLLPGVGPAVRALNESGVEVHVATNQRCVARGQIDEHGLAAVHERLVAALAAQGARVDSIQVCPHDVDRCDCRKPADGLLRRVLEARPYLRAASSAVIGDSVTDVRAGDALGLVRILLAPTEPTEAPADAQPVEAVVRDLSAAVDWMFTVPTPRRNAPGGSGSAVACAVDDTSGG